VPGRRARAAAFCSCILLYIVSRYIYGTPSPSQAASQTLHAGTSLVWPGKILDRMWEVNPRAYNQLAPCGKTAGIPFVLLGITLAFSGVGWFKRRVWGWRLVVIIIVTQVLANFVTALMGGVAVFCGQRSELLFQPAKSRLCSQIRVRDSGRF
jgi:hypothetical protein